MLHCALGSQNAFGAKNNPSGAVGLILHVVLTVLGSRRKCWATRPTLLVATLCRRAAACLPVRCGIVSVRENQQDRAMERDRGRGGEAQRQTTAFHKTTTDSPKGLHNDSVNLQCTPKLLQFPRA